ncbi:unnamed protein product, partial [marine sediment metagenome]
MSKDPEPTKNPTDHIRRQLSQITRKLERGLYSSDEERDALRYKYQQLIDDWHRESPLEQKKATPPEPLPKKYRWERPPDGFVATTHLFWRTLERTGGLEQKIISYLIEHTLA